MGGRASQNRGRVRLNDDWSERGATQAFPFIQQLMKRWNGGRISLAVAAATSTNPPPQDTSTP